ncbi:MAG: signal peptidase II [Bacilli bacterium]
MKKIMPLSFIIVIFDQIIKILITNNLILNSSQIVIENFFKLSYVRNYGAAWSILTGNRFFLIIVAIMSLFLIYKYLIENKKLNLVYNITYGFLIGGLLGNLFDRIVYGYVIDYLDFKIFNYDFPIFNLADICIVLSTFTLIILIGSEKNGNKI